jgi:glycosyltransferase involved in cell wall biosynthesis
MSLRVAIVTQFYPPVAGGAEQYVSTLSHTLVARGHDVTVATIQLDGLPSEEIDGDVALHRIRTSAQRLPFLFESSRKFAAPFADPEAVVELRKLIRHRRPDVIHTHDWLARSVIPRAARGKVPVVATLHDYATVCAQKRLVRRGTPCTGPGLRKCMTCAGDYYGSAKGTAITVGNWAGARGERRAVRLFLPVSRAVAEGNALARYGLPFRVIPNFIPDELTARAEPDHPALAELPAGDFVLFVGDITADKGANVLLEAHGRLADPPPLVMIGRPYVSLARLPPNVTVLGVIPPSAVMAAWRRSLFGVVPSIVPDSCPTVVIEAMATGRPVVASRTGGIPDLVEDGTTGVLVTPGSATELTRAMTGLLSDPAERARMGTAASQRAARFTASHVVPRIEEAYEDAIAGRTRL